MLVIAGSGAFVGKTVSQTVFCTSSLRENGIVVERTHKFKVEEDQKMIRGIIFPTTDRQQPHVQHRAELAGPRLHR